jgi:hypothetical protein
MDTRDLLGKPISGTDAQLLDVYRTLKALAAREDTAPCIDRNVKRALACMWQVVNDLNLDYEQVYDVGV